MDLPAKDASFGPEAYLFDNLPPIRSNDIDFILKQEIPINEFQSYLEGNPNTFQDAMLHAINLPDSTEVQKIPPPTSILPSKENYAGPYDFDIVLSKSHGDRSKWEFSEQLDQIFVMMDCKVPFRFKWNQKMCGLFVRALPVFLAQDSFEEPVRRCASHSSHMEKSNEGFEHVDHIMRCDHSNTMYERDLESQRLSVVVPLDPPQPGSDGTTIVYSFMCKNSCAVGMNRRNTAVIFTLESANGEVVGRKMLRMKICSCPRRDRVKAESVVKEVENTSSSAAPPPNKKVLKRLKKESSTINFNIRLPSTSVKSIATIVKEVITHNSLRDKREMTEEELMAVEDCTKYI